MAATTLHLPSKSLRMWKYNPNTNYSEEDFKVGERAGSTDAVWRNLIKFDFSSLSGNTITSAKIQFYLYDTSTRTSGNATMYFYRMLTDVWTKDGTWNKYDGTNAWDTAGVWGDSGLVNSTSLGSVELVEDEAAGWKEATLNSTIINRMVNGIYNNYGFLAKASSEANNEFIMRGMDYATDTSKRPKMYLEYTTGSTYLPKIFITFDRNLNWTWRKKGGLWQPKNPGLVTA